jgi:hypothetical protein
VEWTVPYGTTFFHLGLHNLAPSKARSLFAELAAITATNATSEIASMLQVLGSNPATLVVFNHPAWDEHGIGQERHLELAALFLRSYRDSIHALELNGLRPWDENRTVWRLAQEMGKPVVSGGDRHAMEPNTILNLTDATHFCEFVEQVRDGWSDVLVTSRYREPFPSRIVESVQEILRDYETHACGWRRWSDRAFYRCDDGVVRPFTALIPGRVLATLQLLVRGVVFAPRLPMRTTLRTLRAARPQHEFAL